MNVHEKFYFRFYEWLYYARALYLGIAESNRFFTTSIYGDTPRALQDWGRRLGERIIKWTKIITRR